MSEKSWPERILDSLLGGYVEAAAGKVASDIVPGSGLGTVVPFGGVSDGAHAAKEAAQRAAIVAFCRGELGKPYLLGVEGDPGERMDAWDCSEITQHAYAAAGLSLCDGSNFQHDFCLPIQTEASKAGDLHFLWSDKWGRIGHVMVDSGDGTLLHALGGKGVVEQPKDQWLSHPRYRGARRHPEFSRPPEDRA